MKFNLKNFPRGDYDNIYEKWRKCFEKELREKLENWPSNEPLIKEILGE